MPYEVSCMEYSSYDLYEDHYLGCLQNLLFECLQSPLSREFAKSLAWNCMKYADLHKSHVLQIPPHVDGINILK